MKKTRSFNGPKGFFSRSYSPQDLSWGPNFLLNIVVGIFAFLCVFPFLFVVMISFSNEQSLIQNGYSFFPERFSLSAYGYVFKSGQQLLRSYMVSIVVTVLGVLLTLLMNGLFAYAISRRDFRFRKALTVMAFLTMFFSGGLAPLYIVITQLCKMKDTIWALIIPMAVNVYYILIMRTFFRQSLEEEILESARIDGAGEFRIFFQIVIPIAVPVFATIAFFSTLAYWNDWFNALMYIEKADLTPIQYMLIRIQNNMEFILQASSRGIAGSDYMEIARNMPRETARMALVVLATGPLIFAYLFFQRFFIKGITIGAIKG